MGKWQSEGPRRVRGFQALQSNHGRAVASSISGWRFQTHSETLHFRSRLEAIVTAPSSDVSWWHCRPVRSMRSQHLGDVTRTCNPIALSPVNTQLPQEFYRCVVLSSFSDRLHGECLGEAYNCRHDVAAGGFLD